MLFLLRLKMREEARTRARQARACCRPSIRLDLDDLGAEVGQHHAAGRAHDHVG